MLAVSWVDVKVVNLISSAHDADQDFDTGFVARYISGHSTQVPCPKAIIDYQQFMRGVDLADQVRATYVRNLAGKKRWRAIFWGAMRPR